FNLDMDFYLLSKNILDKLWEYINNTKDDVVAGLCASIAVLCAFKDRVSTYKVCKFLNIKMSTIQLQVKEKICKRFKISGFTTLVRSAELLKVFLREIGLLPSQGVITLNLNNARRIFNPLNEHCLFEVVTEDKKVILGYLEVEKFDIESLKKIGIMRRVNIDLTLGILFPSKDPPHRVNILEF
ncbi:MAG: hypothetical protein ACFFG0_41425, partial [Candidatus Thorarchaeota archaeon]